jgi:hypothetical protein
MIQGNTETTLRLLCYYNIFIEIVVPNYVMNRRTFLSINAPSWNLHVDQHFSIFRKQKQEYFSTTPFVYVLLTVTFSSRTHIEYIVAFPLQQCLLQHARILRYTYIAYVVNLYRTVWKWLTGSRDRTCTDPLQATALTNILRLKVSYILQYLAIYS